MAIDIPMYKIPQDWDGAGTGPSLVSTSRHWHIPAKPDFSGAFVNRFTPEHTQEGNYVNVSVY